jgi:nucleoside 2-deoxyribosyltransferase
MKPVIYLAGPMNGLTWEEANVWRYEARNTLESAGWEVLSPVDGQLDDSVEPTDVIPNLPRNAEEQPIQFTSSGLVTKDEFYIRKSDWVLCNYTNATQRSIGTVWEAGFAYAKEKLIISVLPAGNTHDHSFLRRRSHIFVPTLDMALTYLVSLTNG